MSDVILDIVRWSHDRPEWQRDALRRLLTTERMTEDDLAELVDLCKAKYGLSDPKSPRPLTEEHVALPAGGAVETSLVSITHHIGVNALAPEQSVAFGPGLAVVYGQNAAGKSGYTRILKSACRSRGREEILGNVLSKEAPPAARATITFRQNDTDLPFVWTADARPSDALATISVFDATCAPVYLREKTDVAFRPFGLDIFDKLAALCADVRTRIELEQKRLQSASPRLPSAPEGTRVRVLLENVTSLTRPEDVRQLAAWSESDEVRLNELRARLRDHEAANPAQRARELAMRAQRLGALGGHIVALGEAFADARIVALGSAAKNFRAAKDRLTTVRKAAFGGDVLPETGDALWVVMWQAAAAFSGVAYPGSNFPLTSEGARCPLCQQPVGGEAADRLKHFAEFMASVAQAESREAEDEYRTALQRVVNQTVERPEMMHAVDELAGEQPQLADRVRRFVAHVVESQTLIRTAGETDGDVPDRGVSPGPAADLESVHGALLARVKILQNQQPPLTEQERSELAEFEARKALGDGLQLVVDEIERQKRLAAYRSCLEDTTTNAITHKSTQMTKEIVTDQLRETFKEEVAKLEFTHLSVEVQAAGGARGTLRHHIVFSNAPNVEVADVLSEGESRALSLAAFLTELSTSTVKSTIVFDDPVSSLDHVWRERIARRLVREANERQVIVFTHDIVFLRRLLDEADRLDVPHEGQYVWREGRAGFSSPGLPWEAMTVGHRLGRLKQMWQAADKLSRTAAPEQYEHEARLIFARLREAWEQAVGEILLSNVVERYRPSIETRMVRHLHDISAADCEAVEVGMTECSRWLHDQAAADATPVPGPGEVHARIDDLEKWVAEIRRRRRK